MLANNYKTPYYAVIFTSTKSTNTSGYTEMAEKMWRLAHQQPGFLGAESAFEQIGITVSYWQSLEAISQWRKNTEHAVAQKRGREQWYASFRLRVAKVEKCYGYD